MKRRQFIALMAGEIVTWPFATLAQQVGRTYRQGPARAASGPEGPVRLGYLSIS
jgi:hypothetical protein